MSHVCTNASPVTKTTLPPDIPPIIHTTLNAVIKVIAVDGQPKVATFRYQVNLSARDGFPALQLSAAEHHTQDMSLDRALTIAKRRGCAAASIHQITVIRF